MTDLGATADDWFHFDFVLGLGANLLPCVPASPDVRVLPGSALEGKVGKIPSQFNRDGLAHGIKDWQKRPILSNEIQLWQADRRLNLCVRTGPISGVYAFDVDVEGETRDEIVATLVASAPGTTLPMRSRTNSTKVLLPFRMIEPCKKRRIKLDNEPKGPAIELLADGQQFVACGTHSSGARYEWLPALPETLPTLTLAQVDAIWADLTARYATPESRKQNAAPAVAPSHDGGALTEISDGDWEDLIAALRFLTDKVSSNDEWSAIGYALLSLQLSRPAEQLWLDFSKKAVGYEPGAPEAWWRDHRSQTPRSDYRSILKLARDRGLVRVADPALFAPVAPPIDDPAGSLAVPGDAGPGEPVSLVDDSPIRPVIRLADARFSEIVDQLETLLVPHVYTQGSQIVRLSAAHTDAKIHRSADATMLVPVNVDWLKKHLGETCVWQKYVGQQWVNTKPSAEHIVTLANLGSWTRLQPLEAVARAPFIRPDGSICDTPGYDRSSRVLYVPSLDFPQLPEHPGRDDARASLERIRSVFDQFPWKEGASESAFLSHVLSEVARLAIDRCPMFFYDAPSPGTGKSLLQEMAARIVHGAEPAVRMWISNDEEQRKSLFASLRSGDRSLWFDNIPDGRRVRSHILETFLTSAVMEDRILGESEKTSVPNKMVLVGSGNNITPVGALARRSLVVRMDANTEHLKERTFKIPNLRAYVMEHRPQLLADALTIIKAFHLTDPQLRGEMPVALPSFERWSRFCRDPLIWLGMEDPVLTQEHETDDETENFGPTFQKLAAHFGEHVFKGLDVARLVNGLADTGGELANDLIASGCAEPNSPLKVGYWLRGLRGRISGGYKLERAGRATDGHRWKLVPVHEDLTHG